MKIGILHRNRQFNDDELEIAARLPQTFRKVVMTISSFYEIDFCYDYAHLRRLLDDLHATVRLLVQNQLTEKSLMRVDRVFQFLTKKEFCDAVFVNPRTSPYLTIMDKIVADLTMILDEHNDIVDHT